jgi:hypothetical protein
LIERSKPTSGEVLRAMIVFGFSTVTVVRSGGRPVVQLLTRVKPVPVRLPLWQVEAGRCLVLGRAAPLPNVGTTHLLLLAGDART